ncbi:hypothetical protein [Bacillus sp. AK128]
MDLDLIWREFLDRVTLHPRIILVRKKNFSGIPFIYIESAADLTKDEVELCIRKTSAEVMKGKRLHTETVFVRQEPTQFVYRHRFFVPQEKMFCCGNLCNDCIRLKT